MKDEEIEVKARELLNEDCFVTVQDSFIDKETAVALITAALRTARNEAIEEAAKLAFHAVNEGAERYGAGGSTDRGWVNACNVLADAIRSLSSKPAGGHDGG